jgi:hypothetical protein
MIKVMQALNIEILNPADSFIRPTRIFTADKQLIIRNAGTISNNLINQVIDNLIEILKN